MILKYFTEKLLKSSLVFFFSLLVVFHSVVFASETECSIASDALQTASRLRGLGILREVQCRLEDKAAVEAYLRQTIQKKIPIEKLKNEGRVYKFLGILPEEFDYVNGLIHLYTSQLGGYYDPEEEYYGMASWLPSVMQMPIAVHELTHALQDQHFELDSFLDPRTATSDALMARSALVEGDATAVMLDYTRNLQGLGSISQEKSISSFMLQNIMGATLSSGMNSAPPALQAMIIFPYVSGFHYVHGILQEGGYGALNKIYKNLPSSTKEVLHSGTPSVQGQAYIELENPSPPKGISLREKDAVFSDRLGEFFVSTLLGLWTSPLRASQAASGWAGDRLALYEAEEFPKGLLLWELRWDTKKDAAEFFEEILKAYGKRFSVKIERANGDVEEVKFQTPEYSLIHLVRKEQKVLMTIGG